MKGKVKFYSEEKGYGFIVSEDDKEYFVHSSGLKETIDKNDDVEFDVEQGDRGPKAVNVRKAGKEAAPAEEAPVEESSEEVVEETTEE